MPIVVNESIVEIMWCLKHRIVITLLLLQFASGLSFAQRNHGMEVTYNRGYLLPHRPTMQHLPQRTASAVDLRYFVQTTGEKAWERNFNYPIYGFSAKFMDLGSPDFLGYGLGLTTYLSLPIIYGERFAYYFEIGGGLGLVSKPYDKIDNHKNIAIGSHINFCPFMGQRITYRVSQSWLTHLSTSFNHFSNAHVRLPNMGINYPLLGLGVTYLPKPEFLELDTLYNPKRTGKWALTAAFGMKQTEVKRDILYPVGILRGERIFGLSKKSEVSLGVDFMYNTTRLYSLKPNGDTLNSNIENMQIGLSGNYHLCVGKLTLLAGAGFFLFTAYPDFRNFYNRAGLRYDLSKNWAFNATIKTYLFRADYFEFGLTRYF